jgi:MFS family permease
MFEMQRSPMISLNEKFRQVSLLSFLSVAVAHEWNLSNSQLASITAVVFAGALLGSLCIWGPIADHFGRRIAFIIGSALVAVGGILSVFAPNLEYLLAMRFFVGVGEYIHSIATKHVTFFHLLKLIRVSSARYWMRVCAI